MPTTQRSKNPKNSPRRSDHGGSSVGGASGVSMHSGDDGFHLRSLIGRQACSAHESAPSVGFGTSQRAAYAIMYNGPGSDKGRPCKLSPGPIYSPYAGFAGQGKSVKFGTGSAAGSCGATASYGAAHQPGPGEYDKNGSVGAQASSQARSAPSYGWGSAVRDTGGGISGRASLGGSYDLKAGIGTQVSSTKHSSPAFAMGTSQRFGSLRSEMRRTAAAPGPGSYELEVSVATQAESSKKSMPAYGFGTSTRVQANKVYWQGKASAAEGTPGPTYQIKSSVGGQVQSDRRSSGSYGFGTAVRFPSAKISAKHRTPGPGDYNA
tara:strand:+ start:647 stop:1609 length:963 start_codon:yes stop_codon:yes gene_type:complete